MNQLCGNRQQAPAISSRQNGQKFIFPPLRQTRCAPSSQVYHIAQCNQLWAPRVDTKIGVWYHSDDRWVGFSRPRPPSEPQSLGGGHQGAAYSWPLRSRLTAQAAPTSLYLDTSPVDTKMLLCYDRDVNGSLYEDQGACHQDVPPTFCPVDTTMCSHSSSLTITW